LSRIETLAEGVRLYEGDCCDILTQLNRSDAIITDPPYGINYGGLLKGKGDGNGGADKNGWKSYGCPTWDLDRPPKVIFELILNKSDFQIIWGGNYFSDYLPPSMQWLVWDKGQRDFSLADFEMAWSSQNKAARIITFPRALALLDGKEHPTQKPIEVMKWCINQLPGPVKSICDPFMGSGTTGVAAVKLGRRFIGIEREPKYFDIACRRISEALKQPDLFIEPPKKAVQDTML